MAEGTKQKNVLILRLALKLIPSKRMSWVLTRPHATVWSYFTEKVSRRIMACKVSPRELAQVKTSCLQRQTMHQICPWSQKSQVAVLTYVQYC